MAVACRKLYNSEPSILLHDQYEDKKVGLRMITFITEVQELDDDGKVGHSAPCLCPHFPVIVMPLFFKSFLVPTEITLHELSCLAHAVHVHSRQGRASPKSAMRE